MSEPKLKPCPFCDDGGMLCISTACDALKYDWYFVLCESCYCQGPEVRGTDNAIAAWNKRAGEGEI